MDDVTVSGTRLRRGTYLCGTVIGSGGQCVRTAVTSVLVGDRFIEVELSVFDNDSMEDFYVPESTLRNFIKDTSASTVQQNTNLESENGYGSDILSGVTAP